METRNIIYIYVEFGTARVFWLPLGVLDVSPAHKGNSCVPEFMFNVFLLELLVFVRNRRWLFENIHFSCLRYITFNFISLFLTIWNVFYYLLMWPSPQPLAREICSMNGTIF